MSNLSIRPYNAEQDAAAVRRIWREIHWVDSEDGERQMEHFLADSRSLVAEVNGAAECLATSVPGVFRYLDRDLRLSAVIAVTTSRIARKQGLAGRLTARRVAQDAQDGAQISMLSFFEQGFYDRLGFGTGPYEHMLRFDPADLIVKKRPRIPRRLTPDDWEAVYNAMLGRRRWHGACSLEAPGVVRSEMAWSEGGFGLGYNDDADGALSHFVWMSGKEEHGPYHIKFMAYRDHDELMEILAMLKTLEDQIRLISLIEPPDIQIQDMLRFPFRGRMITRQSPGYEQHCRATAFWQARICDMKACMAATRLKGDTTRFNLSLTDPINAALDPSAWQGVGGDYVITLGPESSAEPGTRPNLPTLAASVGAFTRMWLGVRPASGLAVTDDLKGSPAMLEALDQILQIPAPKTGWDF